MTDYFCRQHKEKPIVVRFNGGAQAGHTVVTTEGLRHVFHHIGSGYFAGADTFLSRHFLVNPVMFLKECATLLSYPEIYVDPRAPITTIYDMYVNQKIEEARGAARHGSCGMGINETVIRQGFVTGEYNNKKIYAHALYADDLLEPDHFQTRIYSCRNYSFARLEKLGLLTNEARAWIVDAGRFDTFVKDCIWASKCFKFATAAQVAAQHRPFIFEGAQGLLLDQSNKQFFPHVTCSNTGLTNVIEIAREAGINALDVTYVARSYLTRHGAGPLPNESETLSYEDNTNNENPWQGKLRFAPQDWKLIHDAIFSDLDANKSPEIEISPNIAVTHQDQRPKGASTLAIELLLKYESWGPTWKDVHKVNVPKRAMDQAPELSDDAFISHV